MLHTQFRGNRPVGYGEDFLPYMGRGGNSGHVISIMSSDFHFLVPERVHTKFGSDRHRSI